jgi:hypothetical protein
MAGQKFTGMLGLPLARRAIKILRERGIYAHPPLALNINNWRDAM